MSQTTKWCERRFKPTVTEVYQLADEIGGAGYIFTGEHDAAVKHNSATIILNVACQAVVVEAGRLFYSSSASSPAASWIPTTRTVQTTPRTRRSPIARTAWRKLFVSGSVWPTVASTGSTSGSPGFTTSSVPLGTWTGRKREGSGRDVSQDRGAGGGIEIWGDASRRGPFSTFDECLEGVRRLMESNFVRPVNIGSDEIVTIHRLVEMVSGTAGKNVTIRPIDAPLGVRARSSDNRLIEDALSWAPTRRLKDGLRPTANVLPSRSVRRRCSQANRNTLSGPCADRPPLPL
jgi:nucleoside-diphosphate-sugar epimerase